MTFEETLVVALLGAIVGASIGALLGYLGGMRLARRQAEGRLQERRTALLSALRVELRALDTSLAEFEPEKLQFVQTFRLASLDALLADAELISPALLDPLVELAGTVERYNDWVRNANGLQPVLQGSSSRSAVRDNTRSRLAAIADVRDRVVALLDVELGP